MTDAFPLDSTHIHLGLGAKATAIPDFEWSAEGMARYMAVAAGDGAEGRLVMIGHGDADWDSWERHPAGEEVVVLLSGRVDLIQEIDGEIHTVELHPGEAVINPANVWHTANILEPGDTLFITPGEGTEHRPRWPD